MHTATSVKSLIAFAVIFSFFTLVSCDQKRISYVDIVKREKKNIKRFMAENGFELGAVPPKGQNSPEKVFFEPVEGVYIRILKTGDLNDMAVDGKTVVLSRMKIVRFTKSKDKVLDNVSPKHAANYNPAQFIYTDNDRSIAKAPNTRFSHFNDFLAPAMLTALKYVGNHGEVQMIVSFKRGAINNDVQSNGEPLYYERVSFNFKQ